MSSPFKGQTRFKLTAWDKNENLHFQVCFYFPKPTQNCSKTIIWGLEVSQATKTLNLVGFL